MIFCLAIIASRAALSTPQDLTVYEDKFGIPSISAPSDAEAAYALGYVEAKDHAVRMATNYKLARGRLAEMAGKGSLLQDGFIRGLGFEARAQQAAKEIYGEPAEILRSFVEGANRGLQEQKSALPAWIEPVTDVDVLSLVQFINGAFPLLDLSQHLSPGAGSNQFALSASKTTTRHPILSMDPHLAWDGQDGGIVWQEVAIYTPDIHFRGVVIPGEPLGVMGHTDRVAWSMTNNNPLLYTIYTVKLNPAKKSEYSYHGVWKPFRTEKAEMKYLDKGELKSTTSPMTFTEWGPMIPFSNRAVRVSIPDPVTTLEQSLAMLRSKSGAEFRNALKMRGISMWNYVYGDVDGTIGYQYNALVPQHDETAIKGRTASGDDPKSAWGDLWSLDALPHAENPTSGILINCNSDPKLTAIHEPLPGDWPTYVTSYGPTTRWQMLSKLLDQRLRISPERAQEIATDCTVPFADETIKRLAGLLTIGKPIEVLKQWDRKATIDSIGCALYTYWLREKPENSALTKLSVWDKAQQESATASLASAAQKMIAEQGSLEVRWGGIQYMQRGTIKLPVQGFGYVVPGSDLAAVSPASAGAETLKSGQSHTTFGSSFRMIVSLDPHGVQSWSVLPYGNSSNPKSVHFADQMELYAVGKYKPTNFGLASAKKLAQNSYRLIH